MASTLPINFSVALPEHKAANLNIDHITELLVSKYCPDYLQLLLPMLGHQSRVAGERWITWIATSRLEKQMLLNFGVDLSKVRFVYPKSNQVIFDLVAQALSTGNSHCVVAINENFLPEQLHLLNEAARYGNTMGILVTKRNEH